MNNGKTARKTAEAAVIAAAYAALTLISAPLCFGPLQLRLPEALCILPGFTFAAVPGLTLGCFLANLLCGAPLFDVIFGTAATLIGAVGTWLLRKNRRLLWLPPVLSNTLIIPFVLRFAYGSSELLPLTMATVGAGELVSVALAGGLLRRTLEKHDSFITD